MKRLLNFFDAFLVQMSKGKKKDFFVSDEPKEKKLSRN